MTETTEYGTPVRNIGRITDDILAEAYAVTQAGPTTEHGRYGVVVHREDGSHRVDYCDTPEYRDSVLVPFHAFYTATVVVETFGPADDH